jgi:hypothetical protein
MLPAHIIYQQIGGQKFKAMTGAKHFSHENQGQTLNFRLPGKPGFVRNGINTVNITLNSMDTYDMTFRRITIRKGIFKNKVIDTREGIYNDQLQEVFTRVTGLNTRLW